MYHEGAYLYHEGGAFIILALLNTNKLRWKTKKYLFKPFFLNRVKDFYRGEEKSECLRTRKCKNSSIPLLKVPLQKENEQH